MDKTLMFRVKRPGEENMVPPRWREVEVENADCPICGEKMIVISGHKGVLYAYCPKDRKYFIGE